jgi:hypothetical protein
MHEISNYPKYLVINGKVVTKDRHFPLTPRIHPGGKYVQFFLEDSSGNTRFVSARELKTRLVSRLEKSKSRGRLVTHVSGKVFGSIKEACQETGLSSNKIKSHPDYNIA